MDREEYAKLKLIAAKARLRALEQVYTAASGHIGGSLSCMDILTVLYFHTMRVDPADPKSPDRDRFVLSKGHCTPALYAILAMRGFFPVDELKTFRSINGRLSGHPVTNIPGVDACTGSLGQGISMAAGMALAGKMDGKDYRVYAILGDGEIEEGQVWEMAMSAAKYKLDNFCAFVDVNGLQIDGPTAVVMPSEPLDEKFRAFGWNVIVIDGHDLEAIDKALNDAAACKGKPTMIIAKTVKGKGVSYMENNFKWHGVAPKTDEFNVARAELEAQIAELEGK